MKYLKFLLCVFITLFCALPIFSQIPSYIPTNGLVGWWPFNGNAYDESGYSQNGTVYGAQLVQDRNGIANSAYDFNGTTNYIQIASTARLTVSTSYSISAWFNVDVWSFPHPPGIDQHAIVSKINDDGWTGYEVRANGGKTVTHSGTIGGTNYDIGKGGLNEFVWTHVLITYDGSKVRIYFNGIIADSVSRSGSLSSSNAPLRFGRRGGAGTYNNWFDGKLDDIAIWNRALTSQEISTLYNQSCNWNITPLITGSSFAYADSVYTYSVQQQNGRTYQWSTKNGGSIVGSSTNSIVQVEWDTVARDTLLVRETDTQSGCYKDTMLIVSSKFPVYYKATWVNTAPRILPNPTNGMSCYPGTPNCVGGMIDSTTNPGSRSVTFGTFNARPDTIIGINPILPTIRFQIVYRDNGSVIHDTGPLGSDRLTYDSRIGLVTCKLGPFTYDYGRELAMKVISPSGTQTTDIVSLVKANGELYIIPE
jgi:hypothetical protein